MSIQDASAPAVKMALAACADAGRVKSIELRPFHENRNVLIRCQSKDVEIVGSLRWGRTGSGVAKLAELLTALGVKGATYERVGGLDPDRPYTFRLTDEPW